MPDSLFRSGILELSPDIIPPPAIQESQWSSLPLNRILIVVSIILFLINLKDYLRIFPYVMRSLTRPRGHIHIQHNMSLEHDRNAVALCLALPFCLMADRYFLYTPSFTAFVPADFSVSIPAAATAAYMLVRELPYSVLKPRRFTPELESAYHCALLNVFIALASLMLVSLAVAAAAGVPDMAIHTALLVETGVFWLLAILNSAQILGMNCSPLATILYLCALEFIPAGILIYSSFR